MKNLIKNMIPYVVLSSVATFGFGVKYGVYFAFGLSPLFIIYYTALRYVNSHKLKDKRMGDTEHLQRKYVINVLITYAFVLIPVILGFILKEINYAR